MNFKKIITLLLAFTLTLSLAACGSKGDGKGDGDAQGATAEEIYAQIQELADKENAIMEENLELWMPIRIRATCWCAMGRSSTSTLA